MTGSDKALSVDPTVDIDRLRKYRAGGHSKPVDVTQEVWDSLEDLPQVPTRIQSLKAVLARPPRDGTTPAPDSKREVIELAYDAAVSTIVDLLENPAEKGSVKLATAQFVIEQVIGKAKQEVEIRGSFVTEFRAQMRELEAKACSPIIETVNQLDKAGHPLAKFIRDNPPDKSIVGKKGSDET